MLCCKCCRCTQSIESLNRFDLSKPHTEVINKRVKLTDQAEAKSYKKLRLSSFIPESYFVNGQQMNCSASTSQPTTDCVTEQTAVKKRSPSLSANLSPETKPKLAFQPVQQSIYEDEAVNEAETLIGPSHNKLKIDKIDKNKNKNSTKFEKLEFNNSSESTYNFDYNLFSIKKNISIWCIDIALLTSNGQTLKNILNKGSHHLNFLFENKLNYSDDLISPSDEITTSSSIFTNSSTSLENEERKKFNELWSFYLFMFNLGLVCASILLQLLVGVLLLLNTKSSRKQPSFPRRSGECYNHVILVVILFITVINVFIVIFVDETT